MHLSALIKQKSYEHIEYVLRRHWITFVPKILLFLILLAIPVALYALVANLFPNLLTHPLWFPVLVLCASAFLLSVYLFFFMHFIDFYLDQWIVTNDRVVDIEQFGLFARTISELDLYSIQDVTTDVHGVFPTIFNYGDVTVKTASTNVNIVFRDIPNPNEVRRVLIELADKDRKFHMNHQG